LRSRLLELLEQAHAEKTTQVGAEVMRHFEKAVMLQVLDTQWKDHLAALDYLRQGIHLRGYAQKNPQQEYKREAFELFSAMLDRIRHEVMTIITRVQIREEEDVQALESSRRQEHDVRYEHPAVGAPADAAETAEPDAASRPQQVVRDTPKVGRNAPCPCGSGKKYKHCHGQLA